MMPSLARRVFLRHLTLFPLASRVLPLAVGATRLLPATEESLPPPVQVTPVALAERILDLYHATDGLRALTLHPLARTGEVATWLVYHAAPEVLYRAAAAGTFTQIEQELVDVGALPGERLAEGVRVFRAVFAD